MKILVQLCLSVVIGLTFLLISAAAQTVSIPVTPDQVKKCEARDYECQVTEYTKKINADANDIEAYYFLGKAFNNLKKYDQAVTSLSKYISLKPAKEDYLADGYFARGLAYLSTGSLDSALADFNAGMPLKPDNAMAYMNRGLVYLRKSDYQNAAADYTQAIWLAPDTAAEAYYNRALAFEKKNEYKKAIADLDKYISMNMADKEYLADGYFERGKVYSYLGNDAQAISDLTTAIQTFSTKAVFYSLRAKIYRKQGRIVLAEADEKTALSLKK